MSERWICARCYTSSDAALRACPNCGTARGLSAAFPSADAPAERAADPPADSAGDSPAPAPETDQPETPELLTPPPPPPAPVVASAATDMSSGERWVCTRCFASNDGSAAVCPNCGLQRGADPAPGTGEAWSGAPPPPEAPRRRFPWQWVIYGVIALAVVGGSVFFAARRDDSGSIVDAGDLSWLDLEVGDCFDFVNEELEVETVRAIPCDEPHIYETYVKTDYPDSETPSAPNEPTPWEVDQCVGGFEPYVGLDFNSSIYYVTSLSPSGEAWDDGERTFLCFLHNLGETAVTGSARGSAQ